MWSWLLGGSSVLVYWMLGNKQKSGWIAGIISEAGWIAYSVLTGQWGFLACALIFTVVYAWNYRKWSRDERSGSGQGLRADRVRDLRGRQGLPWSGHHRPLGRAVPL